MTFIYVGCGTVVHYCYIKLVQCAGRESTYCIVTIILRYNNRHELGFRLYTKIRLHGRRGKGTAESFSREKLREALQKEGGEILCDFPPVCVTPAGGTSTKFNLSTSSRINGMTTHTHTEKILPGTYYTDCLKKNQNAPRPSEHPPVRGKKCQNV